MSTVTVIGAGSMGAAIAGLAARAGTQVQVLARDAAQAAQAAPAGATSGALGDAVTGDVVALALPYPAVGEVLATYRDQLAGRVVVDITNPLDFTTFDSLVVPAGSSAAAEIAAQLPGAHVLKAFNTTFAATLATGTVGDVPTTVLVAGDDADAKAAFTQAFGGAVRVVDAGALARAHELEALGFLQLTLAVRETIGWTGGFALV
ncbi:NADPH-dependent F420 reductase [Cellulomonas sp. HD19AZ1]|uniref:NADPH-dependent F420 reductase n=1 Tax=Cellulomonas TaxID=1707 RepID=UPI0010713782|nr:NAD(P)-binding domain-containing protein [Cellulomonas sp. HD19AZ1]TFH74262.1 diguanylate cyclase [Cellulomonas sp. HD19AZ1]